LPGQLEFFPMHQFLLSSLNVVHVVVFDATYGLDASFERVSHWLSFVATSIDQRNNAAFGDAPHQRQAATDRAGGHAHRLAALSGQKKK
jgi:hypothetical protein